METVRVSAPALPEMLGPVPGAHRASLVPLCEMGATLASSSPAGQCFPPHQKWGGYPGQASPSPSSRGAQHPSEPGGLTLPPCPQAGLAASTRRAPRLSLLRPSRQPGAICLRLTHWLPLREARCSLPELIGGAN